MSVLLEPNSRRFLGVLADLHAQLGTPANAVQAAAAVGFDAYESTRAMEALLSKGLVQYANDVFGEWSLKILDMQPIMLTRRGQEVVDGGV